MDDCHCLAIMVVLQINSIMMDGAAEGLKFYLIPDFERMKELGIGYTIVTAMNQAFFTLSLVSEPWQSSEAISERKDHCLENLQILRFWIHLWQSYPV